MGAQVGEGTAPGAGRIVLPDLPARRVTPREVPADGGHAADAAPLNDLPDLAVPGAEALVVAGHEADPGIPAGLPHGLSLGHVQGQGFLAQHVFPLSRRRQRVGTVLIHGSRDVDGLHLRIANQRLHVVIGSPGPVLVGELLGSGPGGPHHGHQFAARAGAHGRRHHPVRNVSGADDSPSYRLCFMHGCCPPMTTLGLGIIYKGGGTQALTAAPGLVNPPDIHRS